MAKTAKKLSKKVPSQKPHGKNWVMAVDPFAGFDMRQVLSFARQTAESAGAKLHAVYVLAPAGLNWTGDFSGPWFEKYGPIADQKLVEVLSELEIPHKVIECKGAGQREAVKCLLNYTRKVKADALLISTHARRGLERMAMGSFAETLITLAKIPVIVTNPTQAVPQSVRRILVPTDLSGKNTKFISMIGTYAKAMGAEVVLYYKQPDPLDPIIQQGVYALGGGWVSAQSYIDDELQRKTRELEKLEQFLTKRGVTTSHVLDSSPGDLIESIDRVSQEKNCDMISVVTHAGSWTATLLGSVARGLVRHAHVPVLVQH